MRAIGKFEFVLPSEAKQIRKRPSHRVIVAPRVVSVVPGWTSKCEAPGGGDDRISRRVARPRHRPGPGGTFATGGTWGEAQRGRGGRMCPPKLIN